MIYFISLLHWDPWCYTAQVTGDTVAAYMGTLPSFCFRSNEADRQNGRTKHSFGLNWVHIYFKWKVLQLLIYHKRPVQDTTWNRTTLWCSILLNILCFSQFSQMISTLWPVQTRLWVQMWCDYVLSCRSVLSGCSIQHRNITALPKNVGDSLRTQ